jgi:hypothetical protein
MKQLLFILASVVLLGTTMYMLNMKTPSTNEGVPYEVVGKYLMWKH